MSWTNDVVLEFLDYYRTEQLLWDPKHPLHRNRSEVIDAWNRIHNNLSINCSVTDLKKKKESLMTSFRLHLNRKRKSGGRYHTSWFAFSLMESFLSGKYECDSTNIIDHEYQTDPSCNTQQQSTGQNIGQITVNASNRQSTNRKQNRVADTKYSTTDYIYTKKTGEDSVNYNNLTEVKKDSDEYELYGQLLAKKLRKLDEHQRDVAMHEIDNIMFRAKMQSSQSQNRSFSTSPNPSSGCRKVKSPLFIVTQQSHDQFEEENISYTEHDPVS